MGVAVEQKSLSTQQSISRVALYVNNEAVPDILSLSRRLESWTFLTELPLTLRQPAGYKLPVDCPARNMLIVFTAYSYGKDGFQAARCPRCGGSVYSRHGVCAQCHENVYQCKSCRNINFDNLQGFMCNECGYCQHVTLKFSFNVRTNFSIRSVTGEEECKQALARLQQLAHQIAELNKSIIDYSHKFRMQLLTIQSSSQSNSSTASSSQPNQPTQPKPQSQQQQQQSQSQPTIENSTITPAIIEYSAYNNKCHKQLVPLVAESVHIRHKLAAYLQSTDPLMSDKLAESVLLTSNPDPKMELLFEQHQVCLRCLSLFSWHFSSQLLTLLQLIGDEAVAVFDGMMDQIPNLFANLCQIFLFHVDHRCRTDVSRIFDQMLTTIPQCATIFSRQFNVIVQLLLDADDLPNQTKLIHHAYSLLSQLKSFAQRDSASNTVIHLQLIDSVLSHSSLLSDSIASVLIAPSLAVVVAFGPESEPQSPIRQTERKLERSPRLLFHIPGTSPQLQASPRLSNTSPRITYSPFSSSVMRHRSPHSKSPHKSPHSKSPKLRPAMPPRLSLDSAIKPMFEVSSKLMPCFIFTRPVAEWLPKLLFCPHSYSVRQNALLLCRQMCYHIAPASLFSTDSTVLLPALVHQRVQLFVSVLLEAMSRFFTLDTNIHVNSDCRMNSAEFFALFCELLNREVEYRHDFTADESKSSQRKRKEPNQVESVAEVQVASTPKLFAVSFNCVQLLFQLITEELHILETLERAFSSTLWIPQVLFGCCQIVFELCSEDASLNALRSFSGFDALILNAYFCVNGLVLNRSSMSQSCASLLLKIIKKLFVRGSDSDKSLTRRSLIAAFMKAVASQSLGIRSQIFVMEQVLAQIVPTITAPECKLLLRKAASQEEFIRGRMKRTPYSSQEMGGPLMRHVMLKICKDLGMSTEDNLIELLVANKIINLDLPISRVYDQVWRPSIPHSSSTNESMFLPFPDEDDNDDGDDNDEDESAEESAVHFQSAPMTVVFRLIGVDGEATEDKVDSLPEKKAMSPEDEFAITAVMNECNGMATLIDKISQLTAWPVSANTIYLLQLLIQCLHISSHVAINREALQCHSAGGHFLGLHSVNVLMSLYLKSLDFHSFEEHLTRVSEIIVRVSEEQLLPISTDATQQAEQSREHIEKKLKVAESSESEAKSCQVDPTELKERGALLASSLQLKSQSPIMSHLLQLTHGHPDLLQMVFRHFQQFTDWHRFDLETSESADWVHNLSLLSANVNALCNSPVVDSIRSFFVEAGVAESLFVHLATNLSNVSQLLQQPTEEQSIKRQKLQSEAKTKEVKEQFAVLDGVCVAMEKPSLPIVLQILAGLVKGNSTCQHLALKYGAIQLLHSIEGVTSSSKVGPMAETLLTALTSNSEAASTLLEELRKHTKQKKRKLAMAKRAQMLKEMGVNPDTGKLTTERKIGGMQDEMFQCVVCREGLAFKAHEMFGVYVFCRELWLPEEENADEVSTLTTVTHFHLIHYSCHKQAVIADKKLKPPKKEWEGATIRNSHTLCNNIFPLLISDSAPQSEYPQRVREFLSSIQFRSHFSWSMDAIMMEDLRMMIYRFAYDENFSAYCNGGGKESNVKLVPFLIQMTVFFLRQLNRSGRNSFVQQFVDDLASPRRINSLTETESVMVRSLFLMDYSNWQSHRIRLLERTIQHQIFLVRHDNGVQSFDLVPSFDMFKPNTLFWWIIDTIHSLLHNHHQSMPAMPPPHLHTHSPPLRPSSPMSFDPFQLTFPFDDLSLPFTFSADEKGHSASDSSLLPQLQQNMPQRLQLLWLVLKNEAERLQQHLFAFVGKFESVVANCNSFDSFVAAVEIADIGNCTEFLNQLAINSPFPNSKPEMHLH